ncbi:metalloregulator ArsR/SmtB family transcription factor [Cellulomonas sp. ACRRI]|uniref:ArsR/SmtB family transcription factor n=1 Tax=Cellulomonas sp. ACRRI TaxID=2918188 RepID=UPI001EF26808|nr:metalloregulator ArsR/SmtB family transcription factor [Cellulomonas sp. ACRRI]MCG7287163.1 metalloregulator ArsR/SmtB family transcription factor [Cellulomonas sp. ACRRI]
MTSPSVDDENQTRSADDAALTAPAAALFRALGEPARLTMLRHLFTGEHSVRELTDHLGLAQSTVSAHLACLRDCGLVTVRQRGRASIYAIADPGGLAALVGAAEELLRGGSSPGACAHLAGDRP